VVAVVEPDADDLLRVGHRRAERRVRERDRVAVRLLERAVRELGEPVAIARREQLACARGRAQRGRGHDPLPREDARLGARAPFEADEAHR